ncbi:sugar transferase [Novosphingobium guangzhouense]|uniref:UDP-phosphate galactose phosphotransferase n=1 Tax=Novosphingobium guangzhouense TaxID=1850347 RepID=A0A2K2G163_9SPHN|nr:sugar transferase [Novosphingobium guangzhouense]PNU04795.1 UDP-phosphate galactose phosphotransferase [Novosphingobium guangzhouense]
MIAPPENVLSRPIDIALSLALLVLFLPVLILIAMAVWLDDRGPVIFAQRRVGRNGRMFRCLKFRSMRVDAQQVLGAMLREDAALRALWERDHKLPRDPRITRLGRYLRLTSLDELPQLVNVLRGDMSIVGPRPIVEAEVPRYGRYIHHYYAVRPGLTGLWQVSGRSSVTYRRRVAADVTYIRARTLTFDARILFATIPAVVLGRGSC